jgi:hypothetical protein
MQEARPTPPEDDGCTLNDNACVRHQRLTWAGLFKICESLTNARLMMPLTGLHPPAPPRPPSNPPAATPAFPLHPPAPHPEPSPRAPQLLEPAQG